jgi:hypothetical protein
MTFNRANTLKERNNHHYGKHIKRRRPSSGQAHEKKETTITKVNALEGNNRH